MFSPRLDTKSSGRGPTGALWKHFQADPAGDPAYGLVVHEDFPYVLSASSNTIVVGSQTSWTGTVATAGTVTPFTDATAGESYGVALLTSSSTNAQGIQIQGGAVVVPTAGMKIGLEARVKTTGSGTPGDIFAGFAESDSTVIASDANSTANHVGYEGMGTLAMTLHTEDGGNRVSGANTAHTLVDDTYVKLGVLIDGVDSVTSYVDGEVVDVGFSATPDVPVGTSLLTTFAIQSAGTTTPLLYIDWVRIGVTTL